MSESPKVVHLGSGKPYEAPPAAPDPDDVDRGSILVLEDVMQQFEAGALKGCMIIAWSPADRTFKQHICIPAHEDLAEATLRYAGGLELVRSNLLDLHAFGDLDYDEDDEE